MDEETRRLVLHKTWCHGQLLLPILALWYLWIFVHSGGLALLYAALVLPLWSYVSWKAASSTRPAEGGAEGGGDGVTGLVVVVSVRRLFLGRCMCTIGTRRCLYPRMASADRHEQLPISGDCVRPVARGSGRIFTRCRGMLGTTDDATTASIVFLCWCRGAVSNVFALMAYYR
jgi:hypothetical protein